MPTRKTAAAKTAAKTKRTPRANKQQRLAMGEKILQELAQPESQEEEGQEQEQEELTVEGAPVPLKVEEEPTPPAANPAMDRLLNRWSQQEQQEEEGMNSATPELNLEAQETENNDKYSYSNFASVIPFDSPVLRGGETLEEAIARLASLNPAQPYHDKPAILGTFTLDANLDDVAMARALSEVGLALDVVGVEKYRVHIHVN